ncbi:MAG: hypothetical protein KBD23_00705, partial [Gammaproteobacteria bacterium]|nr:hypothetical protein [Gammaproteobacteria bacterium]
IAIYKTVANLAKQLGIDPDLIYKWRNEDIRMPLSIAICIEDLTNIDFERLCPYAPKTNFLIKNRHKRKSLIKIEISSILVDANSNIRRIYSQKPMIIGGDRVLISGLYQLEVAQLKGCEQVTVLVIDLESLFLGMKAIHEFSYLSISEKIEIGLRLERLMGHPPGESHDLKTHASLKINKNTSEPIPIWGAFTGRKDIFIAKILGYSTNTYYRAKQVYLHGIPELIQAMDLKKVRINKAYTLSKLNEIEQTDWIQSHLKEAPVL